MSDPKQTAGYKAIKAQRDAAQGVLDSHNETLALIYGPDDVKWPPQSSLAYYDKKIQGWAGLNNMERVNYFTEQKAKTVLLKDDLEQNLIPKASEEVAAYNDAMFEYIQQYNAALDLGSSEQEAEAIARAEANKIASSLKAWYLKPVGIVAIVAVLVAGFLLYKKFKK